MIVQRAPDQIARWSLAFFERGDFRGARFVPGRFKHVVPFGYSDPCRTWVVLDLTFGGMRPLVFPDGAWGLRALADLLLDASVLDMPSRSAQTARRGSFLRPLTCVSFAGHLVGVRGALFPDQLWRSCLRNGAVIAKHGQQQQPVRALCPTAGA